MLITITALAGSLASNGCTAASSVTQPADVVEFRRAMSVLVSPRDVVLDSGQTQQMVASVFDAQGLVMRHIGITWTSLDTTIATVNAAGLVTARRSGSARVSAAAGDRADTATVTVREPLPLPVNIVFNDDFESGTLSKWQDGVSAAKHRVVRDASHAAGGSHYLEITYPSGGDGGWLTRFFMPGYDSLSVRYDVQFDASWTGGSKLLNFRGSRTDNQWSSFGQAGKCPDGLQWFATNVVMLPNENPGPMRFYTYFPGMQPQNDGVTCWGLHSGTGLTNYSTAPALSRGVWHRIVVFVKLNSPGQSNGVQRAWVDGQLRGEWSGLALRGTNLLKLNSITLEGSLMGAAQTSTRRLLVDNVTVAY